MYLALVYLFALIGIIFIYLDLDLPSYYMAVVLFFNFKWIFNYRQCTISYLECVVRGVKRKHGLLNSFLDGIIDFGASPRATIIFIKAAKARAFIEKRGYEIPEDIRFIGKDVLRHRIILTYEAEAEEMSSDDVIDRLFESIEVP